MSDKHCTRSGHYRWVCFECAREERRKLERERDEALRQLKERGVICASDFCQYDTYLDLRNCRDAAVMDAREKVAENARQLKAIGHALALIDEDFPDYDKVDCARRILAEHWNANALEVKE